MLNAVHSPTISLPPLTQSSLCYTACFLSSHAPPHPLPFEFLSLWNHLDVLINAALPALPLVCARDSLSIRKHDALHFEPLTLRNHLTLTCLRVIRFRTYAVFGIIYALNHLRVLIRHSR